MKPQFAFISMLWFAPLYLAALYILHIRFRTSRRTLVLHAVAGLSLILATAGIRFQRSTRQIQLVVAADISPSIYELNAQTTRIRELLGAMDPESTQAAVVVFSNSAALERSMAPLPRQSAEPSPANPAAVKQTFDNSKILPDLSHPMAVVNTDGTDIGAALQFSRNVFASNEGTRAILLQSDFRNTRAPNARAAAASAAFLQDAGIDLLVTPSVLGPSSDVQLAELQVPTSATVGRAIPIDVTVATQKSATVVVNVWRHALNDQPVFVGTKTLTLDAGQSVGASTATEIRKTARFMDHPNWPGVAIYSATLTGPDGPIPGDVLLNNTLNAAVRIGGQSKWAVLARQNSTLEKMARDASKPLGVDTQIFLANNLPQDAASYAPFAGILVDGFSAEELPESSAALRALSRAVENGKALVVFGGENAFGAGGHSKDGQWENLLPVEMTPEDDRARAVLFVIDVSKSMDDKILQSGSHVRKMDFAAEQLQAVTKLRPQDRLGLIEFSGGAAVASPLSNEATRSAFLNAIHDIRTEAKTDFMPALELAQRTLDADDADEKIVIVISDGVDTSGRPREDILRAAEKLCPKSTSGANRKTTLWTFGIDVGTDNSNATGEQLLIDLAALGGGHYSRDFLKLGDQLSKTLDQGKKEFFTRREEFVPHAAQMHALTDSKAAWPALNFRNRVKPKSSSDVALISSVLSEETTRAKKLRSDPLLILSGPTTAGFARRAVLALNLDGENGMKLLAPESPGRTLIGNIISWAEAREENAPKGISLSVEPAGYDELLIDLNVIDPVSREPRNDLRPTALLTLLKSAGNESVTIDSEPTSAALKIIAPGTYHASFRAPPAAVCRLTIRNGDSNLIERFVSTPCAAEMRRFGVDRAAMAELVSCAGKNARTIESVRDLTQWAAEKNNESGSYDPRAWLIGLALGLLLLEYGSRGRSMKDA